MAWTHNDPVGGEAHPLHIATGAIAGLAAVAGALFACLPYLLKLPGWQGSSTAVPSQQKVASCVDASVSTRTILLWICARPFLQSAAQGTPRAPALPSHGPFPCSLPSRGP